MGLHLQSFQTKDGLWTMEVRIDLYTFPQVKPEYTCLNINAYFCLNKHRFCVIYLEYNMFPVSTLMTLNTFKRRAALDCSSAQLSFFSLWSVC